MALTLGYRIPGSDKGGRVSLPDEFLGVVTESDVDEAATRARAGGVEPKSWVIRTIVLCWGRERLKLIEKDKRMTDKKNDDLDLLERGLRMPSKNPFELDLNLNDDGEDWNDFEAGASDVKPRRKAPNPPASVVVNEVLRKNPDGSPRELAAIVVGRVDEDADGLEDLPSVSEVLAATDGVNVELCAKPGVPFRRSNDAGLTRDERDLVPHESGSIPSSPESLQQLHSCLDAFDLPPMTARGFMERGTEALNNSLHQACLAGVAFWAAQESLKNTSPTVGLDENPTPTGGVDTFLEWMEHFGLVKQRVYECIKLAKYYARLPENQRSKMLNIGKKQALLLAKIPQEVIDQAAESGDDLLNAAETMTYHQLRDKVKQAERRNQHLSNEVEHREAIIKKLSSRNPQFTFEPETHMVREECLAFQAEGEIALNSIQALFGEVLNEAVDSPERLMRIEQVWVTAHVMAARAQRMLLSIRDMAPVYCHGVDDVRSHHTLTDDEASRWLHDYQTIERKHAAAAAEREHVRKQAIPQGPGRPRKK